MSSSIRPQSLERLGHGFRAWLCDPGRHDETLRAPVLLKAEASGTCVQSQEGTRLGTVEVVTDKGL